MTSALLPRLDSIMSAAIADRATPGAAVAVGRRGKLVVSRGFGRIDWAPGAAMVSDSTLYDMASLTKVVAATTAAMLLEESGQLDIDRSVARYLPAFDVPEKRSITVRMLLTHTSGMKSWHPLWREAKGREQYLAGIVKYPLAHAPGDTADYTDWNMVVLQLVIERITGQPLDVFLQQRVFGPLGMRDTRYNPDADIRPRVAPTETEDFRGGQVWGVVHDETAWVLGGVSGNAGLFSSARDLAVFAQMMLNGGSYNGVRLLRSHTIARWTARQRADASRALGWDTPSPNSSAGRYLSARSWGHTGFTGTSLWVDPELGLFVVLLTNRVNPTRDNQKIGPLRRLVMDAIATSVMDQAVVDWERVGVGR
ncbi:MAG: serine hydrolase domain-containing protein [Gemmatimonadaceae bacterium]